MSESKPDDWDLQDPGDEDESTTSDSSNLEKSPNQDDNGSESDEAVEAEVVETTSLQPTEEVESLSTFTETEGPFSYKIIPVIRGSETDWRVVVYMSGVQGPVYESTEMLSDAAADELGMSRRLQTRINDALAYADKNLNIPAELGNQTRQKRSLHELEVLMEDEC